MRENRLRTCWSRGEAALGCWLTLPCSFSAEMMAHVGFDWLCVDMQHGLIDYGQTVTMLQGMSSGGLLSPLVRVPWNEPGMIGKCLDAGALGVIVPLVNTRAEAEAVVRACRYMPVGARSFGPLRAEYVLGDDYYAHANEDVCCIVMIETGRAVGNLDEILSVPGVDAVYVGPADLSVSLGLEPAADHDEEVFSAAIDDILAACRRHGVVPGIACGDEAIVPKRLEQGFLMVEIASDDALLAAAARRVLRKFRPEADDDVPAHHL